MKTKHCNRQCCKNKIVAYNSNFTIRAITTILLISLIINTGYYGIDQIMIFRSKWNAASMVRSGKMPESILRLTLEKGEARVFDGDEISYEGRLYDVVKKYNTPDSVIFFLFRDTEEQDALTDLVNYFSSDISNLFPNSDRVFLVTCFHGIPDQIAPPVTPIDSSGIYIVSVLSSVQRSNKMLTGFKLIPTPPPRSFLI